MRKLFFVLFLILISFTVFSSPFDQLLQKTIEVSARGISGDEAAKVIQAAWGSHSFPAPEYITSPYAYGETDPKIIKKNWLSIDVKPEMDRVKRFYNIRVEHPSGPFQPYKVILTLKPEHAARGSTFGDFAGVDSKRISQTVSQQLGVQRAAAQSSRANSARSLVDAVDDIKGRYVGGGEFLPDDQIDWLAEKKPSKFRIVAGELRASAKQGAIVGGIVAGAATAIGGGDISDIAINTGQGAAYGAVVNMAGLLINKGILSSTASVTAKTAALNSAKNSFARGIGAALTPSIAPKVGVGLLAGLLSAGAENAIDWYWFNKSMNDMTSNRGFGVFPSMMFNSDARKNVFFDAAMFESDEFGNRIRIFPQRNKIIQFKIPSEVNFVVAEYPSDFPDSRKWKTGELILYVEGPYTAVLDSMIAFKKFKSEAGNWSSLSGVGYNVGRFGFSILNFGSGKAAGLYFDTIINNFLEENNEVVESVTYYIHEWKADGLTQVGNGDCRLIKNDSQIICDLSQLNLNGDKLYMVEIRAKVNSLVLLPNLKGSTEFISKNQCGAAPGILEDPNSSDSVSPCNDWFLRAFLDDDGRFNPDGARIRDQLRTDLGLELEKLDSLNSTIKNSLRNVFGLNDSQTFISMLDGLDKTENAIAVKSLHEGIPAYIFLTDKSVSVGDISGVSSDGDTITINLENFSDDWVKYYSNEWGFSADSMQEFVSKLYVNDEKVSRFFPQVNNGNDEYPAWEGTTIASGSALKQIGNNKIWLQGNKIKIFIEGGLEGVCEVDGTCYIQDLFLYFNGSENSQHWPWEITVKLPNK